MTVTQTWHSRHLGRVVEEVLKISAYPLSVWPGRAGPGLLVPLPVPVPGAPSRARATGSHGHHHDDLQVDFQSESFLSRLGGLFAGRSSMGRFMLKPLSTSPGGAGCGAAELYYKSFTNSLSTPECPKR